MNRSAASKNALSMAKLASSPGLGTRITLMVLAGVLLPLLTTLEYAYSEYTNAQRAFATEKAGTRHFFEAQQHLYKLIAGVRTAMAVLSKTGAPGESYGAALESTGASFIVLLNRNGDVIDGESRYVVPVAGKAIDGLDPSGYMIKALPGTTEHRRLHQERSGKVPEVLPQPLDGAPWLRGRVLRGCRLSHLPILENAARPFGYEILDKATLQCLGVNAQLGADANLGEGLVLLVALRDPRSGGFFVGGTLLNNLVSLTDHFAQRYAIVRTTFFLGDRAVLTSLDRGDGRPALGRRVDPGAFASVNRRGDPYSKWQVEVGGQKLQEWYLPLYRDAGSGSPGQVVGVFGYATDETTENDLQKMHFVFLAVALASVIATLLLKIPLTRMLVGKELEIERGARRSRAILSAISQGVLVLDGSGTIQSANEAAMKLTGCNNLTGKNIGTIFEPNFAGGLLADLSAGMHRETSLGEGLHSEHGIFACECTVTALDSDGGSYLLTFADVAQRLRFEEERKRLAVVEVKNKLALEIHDTLAQYFALILWRLEAAMGCEEPEEAHEHFRRVLELAEQGRREAYRSVEAFSPQAESAALWLALERFLTDSTRGLNVQAYFRVQGETRPIDTGACKQLLRICQEAINNALKHAHATELRVSLLFGADGVVLTVQDNGRGFDADITTGGGRFGLSGMRERARSISAEIDIESAAGVGTTVRVALTGRYAFSESDE